MPHGAHDAVRHCVPAIEPATSRAHIYVAMTRGRDRNTAWIPDPTGTVDPAQVLADAIARATTALTAHQVHERLCRDAGLELSRDAPLHAPPARSMSAGLSL